MHPTTRRHSGLTLVEVIVVVVILTILFGIMLPVLSHARARARIAGSVSNLKQIHAALAMYSSDWDNGPPLYGLPDNLGSLVAANLLDRELLQTGGQSELAVYMVLWPQGPATKDTYPNQLSLWDDCVERSRGNPALILDITHNPRDAFLNPFTVRHVITLWLDGHVNSTRRKGRFEGCNYWITG